MLHWVTVCTRGENGCPTVLTQCSVHPLNFRIHQQQRAMPTSPSQQFQLFGRCSGPPNSCQPCTVWKGCRLMFCPGSQTLRPYGWRSVWHYLAVAQRPGSTAFVCFFLGLEFSSMVYLLGACVRHYWVLQQSKQSRGFWRSGFGDCD